MLEFMVSGKDALTFGEEFNFSKGVNVCLVPLFLAIYRVQFGSSSLLKPRIEIINESGFKSKMARSFKI